MLNYKPIQPQNLVAYNRNHLAIWDGIHLDTFYFWFHLGPFIHLQLPFELAVWELVMKSLPHMFGGWFGEWKHLVHLFSESGGVGHGTERPSCFAVFLTVLEKAVCHIPEPHWSWWHRERMQAGGLCLHFWNVLCEIIYSDFWLLIYKENLTVIKNIYIPVLHATLLPSPVLPF